MKISNAWVFQRRMELLSKTSDAEKAAFKNIRKLGLAVVQQYAINTGRKVYFADLYIPALRCVVEIDGGYHSSEKQKRKDKNRSQGIWRLGYHVLRLSNRDARIFEKAKSKILRLMEQKSF